MKALVVGGGGREHALAWALSSSPLVDELFIAPGNGGTAGLGTNVPVSASDIAGLARLAGEKKIDLTVVGPEAPLVDGIVDVFEKEGLVCFGPKSAGARLEGSKVFAKEFMRRHGVPTADFEVFDDGDEAKDYLQKKGPPLVIKADGLAAGKGVYVTDTTEAALEAVDEIMVRKKYGRAGEKIVIEENLEGHEISIHAICCGERALVLPSSQDHKRIYEGDKGPNTGGMGAYAPVPSFSERDQNTVTQTIVEPTLAGLRSEGIPYSGVLYAGLMWTASGPKVLEFNVRFGDPETQVILPLLKSDLCGLLYAAATGELTGGLELWPGRTAATVVVAAGGYPGGYGKGHEITGLERVKTDNVEVFHAGTARENKRLVTAGGRVLAVTAWASGLRGALDAAYEAIAKIEFKDAYWRRDIGYRAL